MSEKAVAYVRVSTKGQAGDDRFGIPEQERMIREYCASKDYEITEWIYDKGESGAKESRPGWDKILYGEVKNPPVSVVVAAKTDRISRSMQYYFYYQVELGHKQIRMETAIDETSQFGEFATIIKALLEFVAEQERKNISRRTIGSRIQKAERGEFSGGSAPFGYKVWNGQLVQDEEHVKTVRMVYDMYYVKHMSQNAVARALTENPDVKTRHGKDKFFVSTITQILNNEPFYKGYYKYGKDGVWVKGSHEPIFEPDEYHTIIFNDGALG